jgi:hypothetical protein
MTSTAARGRPHAHSPHIPTACARPERVRVVCLESAFSHSRVWRACGEQRRRGRGVSPQTLRFGSATSIFLGFHRSCTSGWLCRALGGGLRGVHAFSQKRAPAQASSRPAKRHQQPSHAAARYTQGPIRLLRRSLVVRERCCSWLPSNISRHSQPPLTSCRLLAVPLRRLLNAAC